MIFSSCALLAGSALVAAAPTIKNDVAAKPLIIRGTLSGSERRKLHSALQKRQNVPVIDNAPGGFDSSYYLPSVAIGTPPQNISCVLDTGSNPFYVPTSACTTIECKGLPVYNPSASSTFSNISQSGNITYGKGAAYGYLANDTAYLGGYCIANQTFLAVYDNDSGNNYTANTPTPVTPTDCIMGFSYDVIQSGGNTAFYNPIQNLVVRNQLPQNLFGLYLARADSVANAASLGNSTFDRFSGSEISLGAPDASKYTGSFDSIPLISQNYGFWTATVAGLAINNATVPGTSLNVMFDSGFTFGQLPTELMTLIAGAFGGSRNASLSMAGLDVYTVPCLAASTGASSVGFQINQQIFNFDLQDLIVEMEGTCAIALYGSDSAANPQANITAILGDTWLKSVYTVYSWENGGSINVARQSSTAGNTTAPYPSSSASASKARFAKD